MDVDPPSSSSSNAHLKRSSSAPMINELVSSSVSPVTNTVSVSRESPTTHMFNSVLQPRVRRFSASFSPGRSGGSSPGPCIPSRVSQLKQEEGMDLAGREVAHEYEIQSALKMSQSWEDLSLTMEGGRRPTRNYSDPLHLNLPPSSILCSSPLASPSPTRSLLGTPGSSHSGGGGGSGGNSGNSLPARPCFSPGVQVAGRSMPFSPSPSPSPTRKSFTRRSLSPITMRPSPLGALKRKYENDGDFGFGSAPKRLNLGSSTPPERIGLLMAHPLSSSMENTPSPAPGSLSSVGTPDSMSSADSPGSCLFQPVHSPSSGSGGGGGAGGGGSGANMGSEAMMVDATASVSAASATCMVSTHSAPRIAPTRMSVDVADETGHEEGRRRDEREGRS